MPMKPTSLSGEKSTDTGDGIFNWAEGIQIMAQWKGK